MSVIAAGRTSAAASPGWPLRSQAVLLMLWSAPRSRSTAFFRMMLERGDFTGVHEPFSYLAEFGYAEIGGERVTSAPALIAALGSAARKRPVFAKETTGRRYPEVLARPSFLARDAVHTFLIRHPAETIRSYLAISPEAPLHKIGFESQYEVYAAVLAAGGHAPVVIDAGDLVRRPADTVRAYCAAAGIGFRPEALQWQPSDRPEWELSRAWHTGVAASSGFRAPAGGFAEPVGGSAEPAGGAEHPAAARYLAYHLPFYQRLHAQRTIAG
jgi:hypothetical protein